MGPEHELAVPLVWNLDAIRAAFVVAKRHSCARQRGEGRVRFLPGLIGQGAGVIPGFPIAFGAALEPTPMAASVAATAPAFTNTRRF